MQSSREFFYFNLLQEATTSLIIRVHIECNNLSISTNTKLPTWNFYIYFCCKRKKKLNHIKKENCHVQKCVFKTENETK